MLIDLSTSCITNAVDFPRAGAFGRQCHTCFVVGVTPTKGPNLAPDALDNGNEHRISSAGHSPSPKATHLYPQPYQYSRRARTSNHRTLLQRIPGIRTPSLYLRLGLISYGGKITHYRTVSKTGNFNKTSVGGSIERCLSIHDALERVSERGRGGVQERD